MHRKKRAATMAALAIIFVGQVIYIGLVGLIQIITNLGFDRSLGSKQLDQMG